MATAININRYIRTFVKSDEELLKMCPLENIKPLVLPPNQFPFVSYIHGDITPAYTTAGCAADDVDVFFAVVSDEYEETIDIASELRRLLESKTYQDDDVYIPRITVKSISEDYIDNAFIQMIVFNMKVVSKD